MNRYICSSSSIKSNHPISNQIIQYRICSPCHNSRALFQYTGSCASHPSISIPPQSSKHLVICHPPIFASLGVSSIESSGIQSSIHLVIFGSIIEWTNRNQTGILSSVSIDPSMKQMFNHAVSKSRIIKYQIAIHLVCLSPANSNPSRSKYPL